MSIKLQALETHLDLSTPANPLNGMKCQVVSIRPSKNIRGYSTTTKQATFLQTMGRRHLCLRRLCEKKRWGRTLEGRTWDEMPARTNLAGI